MQKARVFTICLTNYMHWYNRHGCWEIPEYQNISTLIDSGSHPSRVMDLTLEIWTPRLLRRKTKKAWIYRKHQSGLYNGTLSPFPLKMIFCSLLIAGISTCLLAAIVRIISFRGSRIWKMRVSKHWDQSGNWTQDHWKFTQHYHPWDIGHRQKVDVLGSSLMLGSCFSYKLHRMEFPCFSPVPLICPKCTLYLTHFVPMLRIYRGHNFVQESHQVFFDGESNRHMKMI